MKKTLRKILNIVVDVLVVLILVVSALTLTMVLTSRSDQGVPNVFGKAPISVLTDSMKGDAPDDFSADDLIICDVVDKSKENEFKKGDIITFAQDIDNDGNKDLVTHRIYKVNKDGTFFTKGDANVSYDQNPNASSVFPPITKTDVLATYHGTRLGGVGGVIRYLQSPTGFFLCILLPMILFFLYQAVRVVINLVAYNKEKALAKAQEAIQNADLTEEQKRRAIEEYLAQQAAEKTSAPEQVNSDEQEAVREPSEPETTGTEE